MEGIRQDLRFGLRVLGNNPGFTAVSVLTLAFAIAAVTNVFSFVNALILRPFAFKNIDRIMNVYETARQQQDQDFGLSAADFRDWKDQAKGFEKLAAYRRWSVNLTGAGAAERVMRSYQVSAQFFPLFGIPAQLGRPISAPDFQPGHVPVVVLGHQFWQQHLGADPSVIGKSVQLDGEKFDIVGVMPEEMDYPPGTDIWSAFDFTPAEQADRANQTLQLLGRLKPGVSASQAQADLEAIAARLEREYPQTNAGHGAKVVGLVDSLTQGTGPQLLLVLAGAAAFVLLLACSNVANLQLARATTRQKEIVMRRALGASRWQIARQLLVESIMLAIAGGLAGLAFAAWGFSLLRRTFPPMIIQNVPGASHIEIDWRVLAFTALVAVLTGILAGLSPALHLSRTDLNDALREAGRGTTSGAGARSLRAMLVVTEVALALILLVGAGLMVRGFGELLAKDPGFDRSHVLSFNVALSGAKYRDNDRRRNFYDEALERLKHLPGVESAARVTSLPADYSWNTDWEEYTVEGQPPLAPGESRGSLVEDISPDYFRTLRIALLKGRVFTAEDGPDAPPVAIVSANLARRLWPDQDPIGKRIKLGREESHQPWRVIVGVAATTKTFPIDDQPGPVIYFPFTQAPGLLTAFVVRTHGDPAALAASARAAIRSIDPDQPAYGIRTLKQLFSDSVFGLNYAADMMVGIGVVALLLAVAGIFAVMTYSVAQRTNEIGVRMALGAQRVDVVRLVVGYAMKLTLAGLAIGVACALALTRALGSLLFGIFRLDSLTFLGVTALLLIAAAFAAYLPARRATKVDPMVALRCE
ncbi:MAG TPA: ABC transporter permease [Terriglobia bacterium]|nr:ABC transporter permease [Terriglobia bacterium]